MNRAAFVVGLSLLSIVPTASAADAVSEKSVTAAMKRAAEFYHSRVAVHGGYVYYYSVDLKQRFGEGVATAEQIWVQPPGTPTVGMAYLQAYRATGDPMYLDAARDAAMALVHGQLSSGGWTNSIDFASRQNGRREGTSSLDDGQTESAIQLVVLTDEALNFQHQEIHRSAEISLKALLAAQFPNGAFPQVWTKPVTPQPIKSANYPDYDWRTEGRIKNYWDMYTTNDNIPGYVAQTLLTAHRVYQDEKYLEALKRHGDFLLLAQMPEPQPGWAQQYNYDMQPIWARAFEPPGVSGDESQEIIDTLMTIFVATGDAKYLEPIPRAIAYLRRSLLPDGRLARYYELKTNKPLYMSRQGKTYSLTYDDSRLPSHYGWKADSRLDELEQRLRSLKKGKPLPVGGVSDVESRVIQILSQLDDEGRWISTYNGEPLVGQPKFNRGVQYISSAVFSENLGALSEYLTSLKLK